MATELTRELLELKQRRAVQFLRNIGQHDDADAFEAMSLDEYAAYKGITLTNPASRKRNSGKRGKAMSQNKTKQELLTELAEVEGNLEEAEAVIEHIWSIFTDEQNPTEDMSKDDLLELIEEAMEEIHDYDPESYPIFDEGEEEEAQAA